MKKVYFAEVSVVDDFLNEKFGDKADGMSYLNLSDEEFKKVSTGVGYSLEGYFNEFNHGFQIPDPDNFFCRVIDEPEEKTSTDDAYIDFYSQMRDVEDRCRNKVFEMLRAIGGEHNFEVSDDNFNLSLPYYDNNGDASNCIIERVALVGDDYLDIFTDDGYCCRLSDFADGSIIFIYEQLYKELNPIQIEKTE